MPELTEPTPRVHASFLAAMTEFTREGRGGPDDETMIGLEIRKFGARWADPAVFGEYITWLRGQALPGSSLPPGYVPSTTLWWVTGTEYLGRLAIRHQLTPRLREAGGHIGYDVRPSARRRGHATAMLAAALPMAQRLGIDSVLVMCELDNTGSRKVIEANGGIFAGQRGTKLHYWVPTHSPRERQPGRSFTEDRG
jgi:predicted acetyltransferase